MKKSRLLHIVSIIVIILSGISVAYGSIAILQFHDCRYGSRGHGELLHRGIHLLTDRRMCRTGGRDRGRNVQIEEICADPRDSVLPLYFRKSLFLSCDRWVQRIRACQLHSPDPLYVGMVSVRIEEVRGSYYYVEEKRTQEKSPRGIEAELLDNGICLLHHCHAHKRLPCLNRISQFSCGPA